MTAGSRGGAGSAPGVRPRWFRAVSHRRSSRCGNAASPVTVRCL